MASSPATSAPPSTRNRLPEHAEGFGVFAITEVPSASTNPAMNKLRLVDAIFIAFNGCPRRTFPAGLDPER